MVWLRIAGTGLIFLAVLHIPIGRYLRWVEDCRHLTPVNRSIFHVHTLFICLVLVLLGLPCLLAPEIFLEPSKAGRWLAWSASGFWTIRLYCQWFVYPTHLWAGKRMETAVHWWFTLVWTGLAVLFGLCGAVQCGWLIRA